MRRAPQQDFLALWNGLPASARDAIGVLALKEAFLRFASTDFVGDAPGQAVRYLTPSGQRTAEREADRTADTLRMVMHEELPDLFGGDPSLEHPNGTDPAWARPVTFSAGETVIVSFDA